VNSKPTTPPATPPGVNECNRLVTTVIRGFALSARQYMRLLKILAVVLLAGVALFVLLNLWLDSRENQKAYYATSADAERDKIAGADAFDRGWLPVVLKSGVSEIREEHNVSTNQGRATFQYTPVFADTLERSCLPLPPDAPVNSPFWRWLVSCARETRLQCYVRVTS